MLHNRGAVTLAAALMAEQNRKTLRSFYCRDYLWELFEVMTRDLGCSMDYLINEAMRHYARSRNYSLANARPEGGPAGAPAGGAPAPGYAAPPPPPPGGAYAGGGGYGGQPAGGGAYPPGGGYGQQGGGPPPAPGGYSGAPGYGQAPGGYGAPPPAYGGGPPPPPSAGAPAGHAGQHRPQQQGYAQQPAAQQPQPTGPPQPPAPPAAGEYGGGAQPPPPPIPEAQGQAPLFLIFNGQKYKIDKEKFIIGRGSQMTDLTIRDGNISRKHAAIIFRGGKYYLKDLDSTNGIDYQGSRIDSKKIEEGDVFHICDYELRFSMQP